MYFIIGRDERMLFFKKKKDESSEIISTSLANQNIFCEIEWYKDNKDIIKLFGYNRQLNLNKILCSQNIFNREVYHMTNPSANIYIPRILYEIDWHFIFNQEVKLKYFKISFYNYMHSTREYSVILEAINMKNKKIVDSFSSTIKVFIDPYELTDNINKFIRYSESYK